ncbi:MAG TPA: ATP-dependent DNA ligase [Polyangiaceae bacterium]|nr:ATP-dependent DNA ligase [Polyangiaceae bacterium]HYQ30445.1 ATP-dependent DNA ligase [Polyangiaceae bacterium]
MLMLSEIVAASREVAATRSRLKKIARLSRVFSQLEREELPAAVGFMCGELRQGRLGLGPRSLQRLRSEPVPVSSAVSVLELDAVFQALEALSGKGVASEREQLLRALFARLNTEEREFVVRLILGELRQGALESIVLDALAEAAHVSSESIRKAMLFSGDAAEVAVSAFRGGEAELSAFSIQLFRPLRPMLAQSAKDAAEAFTRAAPAAVEYKLDGARIQLHREGERVAIYSRYGSDLSEALPEIVELGRSFRAESLVLDGEVIALRADGRPQPFQVTMQRVGRKLGVAAARLDLPLRAFFFDCMYADGQVFVDQSNGARWQALCAAVPPEARVSRVEVSSAEGAEAGLAGALASGNEGIVVKSLASTYEAGRRGAGWIKVKPAPTLDLVVLAAEWGSGRRKGRLSNLHLGARDPETGGFVMLGKTFKGLTDSMLAWQTEKFLELATERSEWLVKVRPEIVVEIAFDGLQKSSTYAGGLALRFARVKRYREDKPASDADTIQFVRELFERVS